MKFIYVFDNKTFQRNVPVDPTTQKNPSKIICLPKTAEHPTQSNKSMTLSPSVLRIVSKISDFVVCVFYHLLYTILLLLKIGCFLYSLLLLLFLMRMHQKHPKASFKLHRLPAYFMFMKWSLEEIKKAATQMCVSLPRWHKELINRLTD